MQRTFLFLFLLVLAALLFIFVSGLWQDVADPRSRDFLRWMRGNNQARERMITVQRDTCPGAPFILPADGYIGLLYGDPRGPYSNSNPHQGIDIFSNTDAGVTPVYAAYGGYLTREADWKSTVIIRVPDDPLEPGSQVWLYYTHMADRDGNDFIEPTFEPGSTEIFIPQGTLLGYTGDFNGQSLRDIWVHLHFSIIKDDGNGHYSNELAFANTLDPSPYLGIGVNYACGHTADGCITDTACR